LEKRKAALLGKRFNVVPLCTVKSHSVTIDSRVLHGIMKKERFELDVSNKEFTGGNQETYWKSIFDFRRLKMSKKEVLTGVIEIDGVAMCVHYRCFKEADRPDLSSISHSVELEENKETDTATQKVQKNDFVIGADPGNTHIVTTAAPKYEEDGAGGNLRQKDMRLLRFSTARYYRESEKMNVRKQFETWNAGVKAHLRRSAR